MDVEIGTEAAQFPEKEYIVWVFLAVYSVKGDTDRYASREKLTCRWEDVYDRQICRQGIPTNKGR